MNQAVDTSTDHQHDPPFSEWVTVFERNVEGCGQRESQLDQGRFHAMRRQIMEAAVVYTESLETIASDCGLDMTKVVVPDLHPAAPPVIATGHQPIVFHSGIVEKNLLLRGLLADAQQTAIGLMISIDTDVGDAGRIVFPAKDESGARYIGRESISTDDKLFRTQRVQPREEIQRVARTVCRSLVSDGFEDVASRADEVFSQYVRLAGQPMSTANTIVRRAWEGANYLELPLSRLVQLPAVRQFIDSMISDGQSLHAAYNATIAKYRAEHKIRNKANPFPSLEDDGQKIELPFWIVDDSNATRTPLVVDSNEEVVTLGAEQYLVPRGMMITTVLRLFASDLFIHGTGGAKYDRCTDQFIEAYLNVSPPRFVAATRTRHLYQSQLAEVAEAKAKFDHVREVQKKFQKYVDAETFVGKAKEQARELLSRRSRAIEDLKNAKSAGVSSADINRELQAVDAEIKAFVQQELAPNANLKLPADEEIKVLETREFPFFFFAPACDREA